VAVEYSHVPHNDVSVNDTAYKTVVPYYYETYHCVTVAYSIQYSNMLYRFVA